MRLRILGILMGTAVLLLAACTDEPTQQRGGLASPTSTPTEAPSGLSTPAGPPKPIRVRYMDKDYTPVFGPLRADLLNVSLMESTELTLKDDVVQEAGNGRLVYAVPGMPLAEGFLVRYGVSDSTVYTPGSYPTCQPGSGAFVYTAFGAEPPPPPLSPVTPAAAYPGGPTPTPVPTPTSSPSSPVTLSPIGVLEAGWPTLNLEAVQPIYKGVMYHFTSFRYINDYGWGASIPPEALEEIEVLNITYLVQANLPSPLDTLVLGDVVTDHVRLLMFKDRLASEVIVVDQCPVDLQGDQFVFYRAKTSASP